MATALAANDDLDAALETEQTGEDKLEEVFERAKCRFDIAVLPQLEQRSHWQRAASSPSPAPSGKATSEISSTMP
jgi:hypothetical protein